MVDQNTPPTANKKKWPLIILVALVVLIGAGFGLYYFTQAANSPTAIARGFLNNLSQNNLKSAYEMTSRQFQTTVTLDDLERFLLQYPIIINHVSVKFPYKAVKKDVATVSGTLTGKDGGDSPITVVIVKDNNKWRVLNLSLNPNDVPREIAGEKK
ncbi:MAG: hypothetical protein A3F16_02920 [Deltaproteobacteria bacterium RIFCSPHIGHO2_12_FULL_43_9]|nr:MAG: hypothetical protein A3F16_02920 [Deltaproteobacteria bacterium RIFCSPHIGHO2_12_FULL_43_9]